MITDDNQDVYINVCLVVLSNCHTVTQSHSYGEIFTIVDLPEVEGQTFNDTSGFLLSQPAGAGGLLEARCDETEYLKSPAGS